MANLRANNLCGTGGRNAIDGSVYFRGYIDGTAADWLQLADLDDLDMGTGEFTFEAWIKPVEHNGTNSPNYMGFFASIEYGVNDSIVIQVKNDGKLRYIAGNGGDDETGSTVLWGNWNHVAIVRSGSTIKGYVNGIEEISSTYASAVDFGEGGGTVIGELARDNYPGDYPYRGFISNLRLIKGSALYTAAFTPPTEKLTAVDGTVLLCCQDSDDPTQEATGKTITAYGNLDYSLRDYNLITNGNFDSSATDGWTASLGSGSAALGTGQSGTFGDGNHLVLTGSGGYAQLSQSFTTVVGRTYFVNAQSNGGDASFISTSASTGDAIITDIRSSPQTGSGVRGQKSFVATTTTYYVILRGNDGGAGNFDTVSVYEAETPKAPKVLPPVGVDEGVVFDGDTKINSQGYMYFPTGTTEERSRGRGLIVANYIQPSNYNTSEYITIQSLGNSIDFGDTSAAVRGQAVFASSTRAVSGSGYVAPSNVNTIDYFTIATTGNAKDFGDITGGNGDYTPISNQTRGLFAGGYSYPNAFNAISYVTIASTGNSTDFGDMTTVRANGNRSQVNSTTRGLVGGGYVSPTGINNIEFLTIATTGNSSDFGDLTQGRGNFTGLSSGTRGVFAGGSNPANNIMDYVTIASAGNAIDFGDMSTGNSVACCSTSNNLRGVIAGGDLQPSNAFTNTMQYVTITTTGNASDFGDMLTTGAYRGMTSDSHGGLE